MKYNMNAQTHPPKIDIIQGSEFAHLKLHHNIYLFRQDSHMKETVFDLMLEFNNIPYKLRDPAARKKSC